MMARYRCERGTSLVEAVVAGAILAIIAAPIFGSFMIARAAQAETTSRAVAQAYVRNQLEAIQLLARTNWGAIVDNMPPPVTNQEGMSTEIDVVPLTVGSRQNLKQVTVIVRWSGSVGRPLTYEFATIVEKRS
jgi:type II secretory pathway pseudopilin PulG